MKKILLLGSGELGKEVVIEAMRFGIEARIEPFTASLAARAAQSVSIPINIGDAASAFPSVPVFSPSPPVLGFAPSTTEPV